MFKKLGVILIGVLGMALYALMFCVIVSAIELALYMLTMLVMVVLWASFSMDQLPTPVQVQTNTAMVFYLTMAVSVTLASFAVYVDQRSRKIKAFMRTEPQPEVFGPKPAEPGSSPKR